MQIRSYKSEDAQAWDRFCENALNATLLHTRRYLGYHGDRFVDESRIIADEKGRVVGLFPAAKDPDDESCIVSHPGITYGGVVHDGRLGGERMLEAFNALADDYASRGYRRLIYKAVPHIYHRVPAQDDLYALYRLGARRFRCDLSSAVNIHNRLPKNERRRRAFRKAAKAGVEIREGREYIEPLWRVLRENLAHRHDAKPVHNENTINLLADYFPEHIRFVTGWCDGELVAGVVIYFAGPVRHAQYIAASERGHAVNALDAVFENCIRQAQEEGANWFDFGISNEQQGEFLNDGLYAFKSEFGGGGIVHEFYDIEFGE